MQHQPNGDNTKKGQDEMLEEYDFSESIPNPYTQGRRMSEAIFLDADIADIFTDAQTVNEILRPLANIVRERQRKVS